jgi:hypothetical protein
MNPGNITLYCPRLLIDYRLIIDSYPDSRPFGDIAAQR